MKEILIDPLDIIEVIFWGALVSITLYTGLIGNAISFVAFILAVILGLNRYTRSKGG